MKNPDNKPLRVHNIFIGHRPTLYDEIKNDPYIRVYGEMLSQLAIAESNLVRAGKDSAMPHFIAIVKELERIYGFKFEIAEEV